MENEGFDNRDKDTEKPENDAVAGPLPSKQGSQLDIDGSSVDKGIVFLIINLKSIITKLVRHQNV